MAELSPAAQAVLDAYGDFDPANPGRGIKLDANDFEYWIHGNDQKVSNAKKLFQHAVDVDPTSEMVTAFIDVSLAPARSVGFDDVAERIARFPEVRSVYLVSGSQDLRCTVEGRTIRAVSDFVSQKLSTIDRVRATATHFVLKTYKRDGDSFTIPDADHRLPVTP